MGCIFLIAAIAVPRFVMFIAFLLTNWFGRAFETRLWPLLGFLIMPYTTLAYMSAMLNNNHALTDGWLAILIAAVVIDASHWGGSGYSVRRRR